MKVRLILLSLAAMFLAACGNRQDSPAHPQPEAVAAKQSSSAAADAPARPPICERQVETAYCSNPLECALKVPLSITSGVLGTLAGGASGRAAISEEKGRCTAVSISPADRQVMMQEFANHQAQLTCTEKGCAKSLYLVFREELASYYRAHQWDLLTETVMKIGYPSDLSWYYLGRAAEEHELIDAAQVYYRAALTAPDSCRAYKGLFVIRTGPNSTQPIDTCEGINFPGEIEHRLANLEARYRKKAIN